MSKQIKEMRDRLIELLFEANDIVKRNGFDFNAMVMAEHLLANGVIVPPCKVGATVYVVNSFAVSEYRIESIKWDGLMFAFRGENEDYADDCWVFNFFEERIGKTVFITRAEAERALERSKSDE